MLNDIRAAIEIQIVPGGSEGFQRRLMAAETADVNGMDMLADLISVAHAAFAIADSGMKGVIAPSHCSLEQ